MKIEAILARLQQNSQQCNTTQFYSQMRSMLDILEPSKKVFMLMHMLVKSYGFAAAFFFYPLYLKLKTRQKQHFKTEMLNIEKKIENLLIPYDFKAFPELQFLILKGKTPKGRESIKVTSISFSIQEENLSFAAVLVDFNRIEYRLTDGLLDNQTSSEVEKAVWQEYGRIQKIENDYIRKGNYFQKEYYRERLRSLGFKMEKMWQDHQRFSKVIKPVIELIKKTANSETLLSSPSSSYSLASSKSQFIKMSVESRSSRKVCTQEEEAKPKKTSKRGNSSDRARKQTSKNTRSASKSPKSKKKQSQSTYYYNGRVSRASTENSKKEPQKIKQKSHLCCRTFFYWNQLIEQPESIVRQYKKYNIPFSSLQHELLKRTVVGFLNECGGVIYIGISESKEKLRRVCSTRINQEQMQIFQSRFREMVLQEIEPDVIASRLITIKFVPIKAPTTEKFIPGHYVIKIIVEPGRNRELYTYKSAHGYELAIRTQNEVLKIDMNKHIHKVIGIMRDRIEGFIPRPQPTHYGTCPEPEKGVRVYH